MIWIFIVIVSYLLGSIPSGYLGAKSQGVDIRQHGCKNIGATNVLRVMGKKWGYFVFFCDALKGFVSVKLGFLLAGPFGAAVTLAGIVAGLCCILGHNFPVWLGFKGGKGIATSGGVAIALFPASIVLLVGLVWLVVFLLGVTSRLLRCPPRPRYRSQSRFSVPISVLGIIGLCSVSRGWPRHWPSGDTGQTLVAC
jgi:acyl-phosphate glycerol 3-phosphate acyltransferase